MKFNKEFFKSMLEYDKILHFVCGLLVSIAVAGMFFKWDTASDTAIIQGFEGYYWRDVGWSRKGSNQFLQRFRI